MAVNRTLIPRTGPLSLAMLAGAVFSLSATASEAPGGDDKPYTVVDGAVDKGTYDACRRYRAEGRVHHGPDGLGSTYAPTLGESLEVLSREDFVRVTLEGTARTAATTTRAMPPFAGSPNVERVCRRAGTPTSRRARTVSWDAADRKN